MAIDDTKVWVILKDLEAMKRALADYRTLLAHHATLLEMAQAVIDIGPGCDGVCPPNCRHEEAHRDLANALEGKA